MKVLLAGASGAIGIPLTRQLIANGHQLLGLTRDLGGGRRLEALAPPQWWPTPSTATTCCGPSTGAGPTP